MVNQFTIIDFTTLRKSLINNQDHSKKACSTEIIIAWSLYELITLIEDEITNKILAKYSRYKEKTTSGYINILIRKCFFINTATNLYQRKLLSLLPTWKYCIAKKEDTSKEDQLITFYFFVPNTDLKIQINLEILEDQIEQFKTIPDQEYYLINYNQSWIENESLTITNLIIIKAKGFISVIPIKHLGFNISDQGQPYLINRDSIIEERV
jgi:hypothetical protein